MHLRCAPLLTILTVSLPRLAKPKIVFPNFAAADSSACPTNRASGKGFSTRLHSLSDTMASKESAYSSDAVVVYVTVPDDAVAKALASSVVEHKLAACVSIIPGVQSVYWWEDKVNIDAELMLMMKTRSELVDELTGHVKSNHPYDECEVISLPITGGSSSYLRWVAASTKEASP